MSLAEALRRIRRQLELIGWDPRHIAQDADGHPCDPESFDVERISIGGAAIRATIPESSAVAAGEATRAAIEHLLGYECSITAWENQPGRTIEEIFIVLDMSKSFGKTPKALKGSAPKQQRRS